MKTKTINKIPNIIEDTLGEIGKKKPKIISKLFASFGKFKKSDKFFFIILSRLIRI